MSKHEQQAKYWLNDASAEYRNGNAKRADLCVGRAQVEATLALAEQQRIANLIALATTIPDDRDGNGQAVDDLRTDAVNQLVDWHALALAGMGRYELRPEIAKALGIEK